MSVYKTILGISTGLIIIVGVLYFTFTRKAVDRSNFSSEITIEQTWELPETLKEVSGIAFLEDQKIAAVQDENGTIFIYNLETSKIEDQIDFSGGGDYEGISVSGTTAYVLKSNGTIYKIENFASNPAVTEHKLPLDNKLDMEGLHFDTAGQRLLIVHKEKDPETTAYKGIYAVDPQNMKLQEEPVYKIRFENAIFEGLEEDSFNRIKPSEINIHPQTGEILILAAENPKLLILDPKGNPKNLHFLNPDDFPQPEGLTFDTLGNLYISNEGNPARIHKVSLN